jgi:hypothetical protein
LPGVTQTSAIDIRYVLWLTELDYNRAPIADTLRYSIDGQSGRIRRCET